MAIRLVTLTDIKRLEMLPQLLDHYFSIGVQSAHIVILVPSVLDANRDDVLREWIDRIRSLGATLEGIVAFPYDPVMARRYLDYVQTKFDPSDWILWVDSDEFQGYRIALSDFLAECHATGVNVIRGRLVDRVAIGGRLVSFDPSQRIWDQYPIMCNFSQQVMHAVTTKIACARAMVRVSTGNHCIYEGQDVSMSKTIVPVHHFNWTRDILDRLSDRLGPDWRRRTPRWVESYRALCHILERKRIDLDEVDSFLDAEHEWSIEPPHVDSWVDRGPDPLLTYSLH